MWNWYYWRESFCSSKSMLNNKSAGNDGLSKEFYEPFWEDIKGFFIISLNLGSLSVSQRKSAIKLLDKTDQHKWFIKNWRPILLFNVDTKILSKFFSSKTWTHLTIYYFFKSNCICRKVASVKVVDWYLTSLKFVVTKISLSFWSWESFWFLELQLFSMCFEKI